MTSYLSRYDVFNLRMIFASIYFPLYSPYTLQISQGAVSISVFKLYLGRILGSCDQHNEQAGLSGPLMLYHHQPRSQIGRVLMAAPDLGSPAPYIPTFYQEYATTANHMVRVYKILFFTQLFLFLIPCMHLNLTKLMVFSMQPTSL